MCRNVFRRFFLFSNKITRARDSSAALQVELCATVRNIIYLFGFFNLAGQIKKLNRQHVDSGL